MQVEIIVQELRERFGCHAVLFYGSRARGDFGPTSDWDLLGIREGGPQITREARWEGDSYLDLFVYREDKILSEPQNFLHLEQAHILCDDKGVAGQLVQKLKALAAEPVQALPEDEARALRAWHRKMILRAAAGDAEGDYRRHWLLFNLLEDYFSLRALRYRGPKQALQWLQEHDAETHGLFVEALPPAAPLEALQKLVERASA